MDTKVRGIVEEIHGTPAMLVLAVAGAGTEAISWLLGVGGASRTVLEIRVPYASSSFAEFVGYEPEQFVAEDTAKEMARSAYTRALKLREGNTPAFGVACTATIATDRPKRGDHRCHIAVWDGTGVKAYSLTFNKGLRDRVGEDELASKIILNTISERSGLSERLPLNLDAKEEVKVSELSYDDPVKAILEGHVNSITVRKDGTMEADATVKGGLLAGSFNPLHDGHQKLASATSEVLGKEVSFELSITNVDKPLLEESEIRRRLSQFKGRGTVVLTRAPVFYEKARLFPACPFVIGWDTAVRLVEPRYYDNSKAKMLMALEEMRRLDTRFIVAGRVSDGKFHTLNDVHIPDAFKCMFTALPESAFRNDISSTELRLNGADS